MLYHFHTLWLFTANDIKAIVYPESAFGIFAALSGSLLTTNDEPQFFKIIGRLPYAMLWLWLNLLLFNISNQRLPQSILEDAVNKPYRPLPSKRITTTQARRLLLWVIPGVLAASLYLGGTTEAVLMMLLTWMYNDLGGADESYFLRNLINACGLMCYSSGAAKVALDHTRFELNPVAYQWILVIGAIVLTTLQLQDMSDQEGDRARGRLTVPLVFGDTFARWTIAVPVVAWSFFCPAFWNLDVYGYLSPVAVGSFLAVRVILFRTVAADKLTWKTWCIWMASLYMLPLCSGSTSSITW